MNKLSYEISSNISLDETLKHIDMSGNLLLSTDRHYKISYLVQVTDTHAYSKIYEYKNPFYKVVDFLKSLQWHKYLVLTGDEVCVTTAPKEWQKLAIDLNKHLMEIFYRGGSNIAGNRMSPGNHNSMGLVEYNPILVDLPNGLRVLAMHSHLQKNRKKWSKYILDHKSPPGFFKRNFLMRAINLADDILPDRDLSKDMDFLEECYKEAQKYGADVVLTGHGHPKETAQVFYRGKEIRMCPQGAHLQIFKNYNKEGI